MGDGVEVYVTYFLFISVFFVSLVFLPQDFSFSSSSVLSSDFNNLFDSSNFLTAKASDSHVLLCINDPPSLLVNCSSQINQSTRIEDNRYYCQLNASDSDNDSFSLSAISNTSGSLWFSLSDEALLLINGSQSDIGNQTLILGIKDVSGCINSQSNVSYDFEILDINDPPVNFLTIPNVNFSSGSSSSPYSLYDYFRDPDFDILNFSVYGSNIISITINQATGDVLYSSSGCGSDLLIFSAFDPLNLSDSSGVVTVTSRCSDSGSSSSSGDDSGNSKHGGSSGSTYTCIPKWKCDDWSECFINGTQFKKCVDLNGCKINDYTRYFWRNCTYVPTCSDDVQNGFETGIDCGGYCKPCGTCFDGILNNDEEGIDCGGSYCDPCFNCSDGIQNWAETGIDCGGPICDACPSCSDGVLNGDEAGIDCGGSCPACAEVEIPGVISEHKSLITSLLGIILLILIAGIILFRVYHRQISKFFARTSWYFTRKLHKQILLSDENKSKFLENIFSLEKLVWEGKSAAISENISNLGRKILSTVLNLSFEFSFEDLSLVIPKKVHHNSLRKIFLSFYDKIVFLEQNNLSSFSGFDFLLLLREYQLLIFQISNINKDDFLDDASELEVSGSILEKFKVVLYNSFLTLLFEETELAKKHYLTLLDYYEKLSEKEKEKFYSEVNKIFLYIRYTISWK